MQFCPDSKWIGLPRCTASVLLICTLLAENTSEILGKLASVQNEVILQLSLKHAMQSNSEHLYLLRVAAGEDLREGRLVQYCIPVGWPGKLLKLLLAWYCVPAATK